MANYKAKLKSIGDKASPSFRQFWTGKLSDKCLHFSQPNQFHGYTKLDENIVQYFPPD
jgi:hypothetical protein